MSSTKGYLAMSEPITSTAGSYAAAKFIPILGPVLAAVVVMCLATPQSKREWVAALVSTVALSVFGGSAVVTYYGIGSWAQTQTGLIAITGICFACGLPAWLIIRGLFVWMQKQKDKDIAEIAKAAVQEVREVKDSVKDLTN